MPILGPEVQVLPSWGYLEPQGIHFGKLPEQASRDLSAYQTSKSNSHHKVPTLGLSARHIDSTYL